MIRRPVYEALGTYQALRFDVLDDMKLGKVVKNAGYAQRNVFGADLISIRWAKGAWGVVDNLTKNFFAVMSFQWPRALASCFALAFRELHSICRNLAGARVGAAGLRGRLVLDVFDLRWHVAEVGYSAVLLRAASRQHRAVRLHHAAFDIPDPGTRRRGVARNVLSIGGVEEGHGVARHGSETCRSEKCIESPRRGHASRNISAPALRTKAVSVNDLTVEVCVDSLDSAIAAERGGANRVELCGSLVEGGVTPSAGLIATARQKISIGLHVMIRPRAGDFYYSADEFEVMRRDVLMAKQLGAEGVVFGILDADANVDIQRTRALVDLARPLKVTYHRAFDMSADLFRSLEQVMETGADRILTSGGAKTALEGAATLRRLVEQAGKRAVIMACGGINDQNVQAVVEETAVREIHVGLRTAAASPMRYRNENISMGSIEGNEYQRYIVLEEKVARLIQAAKPRNA